MNVVEIEENVQELVSKGFDPNKFILDFVKAYDAPKTLIQQLKGGHQNLSDVKGAVLWRRNLHYKLAHKGQVSAVVEELERSQATSKYKARFVISTDGDEFSARDLVSGNTINCNFDELALHFASFLSLAGIFIDEAIEENPIDIKATKRLTKFYDSILQDNPTWKTDEMRHTLNHFITQVIFCLFAEDTGIIADNIFTDTIRTYSESDSEQAQPVITAIFTAMAHPEGAAARSSLPSYAQKFPHVNGGLFRGSPQVPRFLRGSVRYLMDAGALDWKEINPDIFGSMIQAIVHQDQRGELGMHYTSVSNILKLLKPLFLNDLQEHVQSNWNSKKGLQNVLQRLMKIRVFDPACGSGNFLVIAYRELRNIEIQVIRRLAEISDFSAGIWSHVELKNFFGIEYIDFAAETAKLSLWIAEYQMNKKYEDEFGKLPPSLPLKDTNNIRNCNALRISWEVVCPHSDDPEVETYIVGNPPYVGTKKQTSAQKEDIELVASGYTATYKSFDYVCGWFIRAFELVVETEYQCAFVSTNSIVQSFHVQNLWSILHDAGIIINFCHLPFKWKNNASKNAGVTVVIVGFAKVPRKIKTIYSENHYTNVDYINAYLTRGKVPQVKKASKPINILKPVTLGSLLADGNNFILSPEEEQELRESFHDSDSFIKPYIGGNEAIKGKPRKVLYFTEETYLKVRNHPIIEKKVLEIERFRLSSTKAATQKWAKVPFAYTEDRTNDFTSPKIVIPITFSEGRDYMQVLYVGSDAVVPGTAFYVETKSHFEFSILSSRLFFIWMDNVGAKLESRMRFSNTMCWNTFPLFELSTPQIDQLSIGGEGILLARDLFFEYELKDLYNPKKLEKNFPELWEAHQRNDAILETILNGKPFENDTERLEHLFARYAEMTIKHKG
jgi:hypothetical protein